MSNIIKSASKLVFLALTLTACVAFLLGILPVDQFMLLAIGAYAYYFRNSNGESPKDYIEK